MGKADKVAVGSNRPWPCQEKSVKCLVTVYWQNSELSASGD